MTQRVASLGDGDGDGVEPIAVVGLAVRVPGAADVGRFWQNLVDGVESVARLGREEQLANGATPEELDDPSWVSAAPRLEGFDQFDARLFGMSEREAELTDPQHRLFLEAAHTALDDASVDPARFPGAIGVYGGAGGNKYHWVYLAANERLWASNKGGLSLAVGNSPSYLATTVSYKLGLRGPSLTVMTACSTSLVAFHLACEALRGGECDLALAGGASVELPHGVGYRGADGFLSADGHCRPFDARANGTLWGSGVGVVVLKRLSDAVADGDHIRAVALGNAVNNDGAAKVGFSAPSVQGQAEVVAQAVAVAGIDPRTIGYVEAHGTGTALGDPIEVAALTEVYGRRSADRGWCGIGSVKSNIGHLSQASGVVGVVKAVLALERGLIPPTINLDRPNPAVDFDATPFHLVTAVEKWTADDGPRRAGVSSFGIGGTNAHVILEEAPPPTPCPRAPAWDAHLLPLSAASPAALEAMAGRLADHLEGNPHTALADVATTLRVGRAQHGHRAYVVAADPADAVAALRDRRRVRTADVPDDPPGVAFLFSGQGAQYPAMGKRLYEVEPAFAAVVDECADLLGDELGVDLREVLFDAGEHAQERLRATRFTQPALFTVEYALARLWRHWGVAPDVMLGHSIGEYVAATLAGVFPLSDALRLVAARGRLMHGLPTGAMLAVQLDEAALADRLPAEVSLATVNGPGACVVAGPVDAVAGFADALKADGVGCKLLRTSHAFHSTMTEPILDEFRALADAVPRQRPHSPFVSGVTGALITAEQAVDPHYWAAHLRQPVRFGAGLATVLAAGDPVLLECGPGRQLAGLARMQVRDKARPPLHSLPGPGERAGDLATVCATAGALWAAGVPLDTAAFGEPGRRVPLPTYPYQRRRYFVAKPSPEAVRAAAPAASGGRLPLDEWFAVPGWRQAGPDQRREPLTRCLAFVAGPRGEALVAALRAEGVDVTPVRPEVPGADGEGHRVAPGDRGGHDTLVSVLASADRLPRHIVHAWAMDGPVVGTDADLLSSAVDRGFHSATALVQALLASPAAEGVRLDIVSVGTEDVRGDDLRHPEHAPLAGIARVLPLEAPGITVRRIDADPDGAAERVAVMVADELCRPVDAEAEVALRGGRRWVREYRQTRLPAADGAADGTVGRSALRPRGRYLVTGAFGGIGITLAEELARRVCARLVLLGRTALPPRDQWDAYLAENGTTGRMGRAMAAIRRMERVGAEVVLVAADVTDEAGLAEARREADAAFGGLDGIVHSAGIAGGAMLAVAERAAADRVLAPKLAGTLALRRVFGDLALDFVALFSSVTSVAGGFGQADYCAANAFLDAYARSDHGWRARVVSLNWGGWLEVGMAAEASPPSALRQLRRGTVSSTVTGRLDHPLLSRRDGDECAGSLSAGTHWVLDEHRIGGTPVVPGTAHLEAARAAVAEILPAPGGQHVLELRDVTFLDPFAVPDGGTADYTVKVTTADGAAVFQVTSAGGERIHVRGAASWVPARPPAVDLPALRRRCHTPAPNRDGAGRVGTVELGAHWAPPREHHVGSDEELAVIEAPGAALADLDRWVLNPALLDVATSFGHSRGDGRYLPLGYGRITVHAALPARFVCHLSYRGDGAEVVSADLVMADESGTVLVEVEDFVLRRVDATRVAEGLVAAGTTRAAPAGTGSPSATLAGAEGIEPGEGVEACLRVLAANLGPQVVVHTRTVAELRQAVSRVTTAAIEDDLADGTSDTNPVAADRDRVAPRSSDEEAIARVWGEILGVERVGVTDDFFELGGNSLVAVQIIAETRKAVGVRVPMRALFEAPTVAELARVVAGLRAGQDRAGQDRAGQDEAGRGAGGPTIPRLPRG